MTQSNTTIQSNNNVIKGYDLNGVVTPSQGLTEWIHVDGAVNPTNFNNFEISLNVLPHPIFLARLSVEFDGQPSQPSVILISLNEQGNESSEFITENGKTKYTVKFDKPVKPEDVLLFRHYGSIGAKINKIDLRGHRIALATIQANFGDV